MLESILTGAAGTWSTARYSLRRETRADIWPHFQQEVAPDSGSCKFACSSFGDRRGSSLSRVVSGGLANVCIDGRSGNRTPPGQLTTMEVS